MGALDPTAVSESAATAAASSVTATKRLYTREDVAKHNTYEDAWLIYNQGVYDISRWVDHHPGGKVLLYYRGQDATEPINAFHSDMEKTKRFLKPLHIGDLTTDAARISTRVENFRQLRQKLVNDGYFKPNYWFYIWNVLSIFFMEYLAFVALQQTGSYLIASLLLATAQIQAGWLQHDLGHCALFTSTYWNQAVHYFLIGHLKGASSWWWKCKHNRHHAKTNIVTRDPDMHIEPFFSFSKSMSIERFSKYLPILQYQHKYWYFLGPPMVTTILFVFQNMVFLSRFGNWTDMLVTLTFYVKYELIFHHVTSGWGLVYLYVLFRFWESLWFTWVTSMNHLPMPIIEDGEIDWLTLQVQGTQNSEGGAFNDWFTGHLNYQMEHHLFPTMPRHRYPEVSPFVKALCEKEGLPYRVRTIFQSCCDIMDKLESVAGVFAEELDRRKKLRAERKSQPIKQE